MTLEQIDQMLAEWEAKVASAQENLLALYEYPAYQRIDQQKSGSVSLTGATAVRVNPALDALNELFSQIDLLHGVVDRAAKLRKSVGWLGQAEHIRKIEELINGPSITLPPIQTPLAQRGLLTSAEVARSITPAQLLAAMQQAFDTAKKAILDLDAVWNRVEVQLASARDKLSLLQGRAEKSGVDRCVELKAAADVLEAARDQLKTDPFGTEETYLGRVPAALEQAKDAIDRLASEREAVDAGLRAAERTLQQIVDLREQYHSAKSTSIDAGDNGALTDAQIEELTSWLDSLKTTARSGNGKPVQVGLERWNELAEQYRAVQQAATTAVTTASDNIADLRGRFSALRVKASARGLDGDPELARIEDAVDKMLASDRINLRAITVLVTQFEQRISVLQHGAAPARQSH